MATEPDKVNTLALGTIVVAGAFILIAIAAGLTALVRNEQTRVADERSTTANLREYRERVAREQKALSAPPAWIDRDAGSVSIPLDRAMALTLERLRLDPEAATPGALPASAPADAGGVGSADAGSAGAPSQGPGADDLTGRRSGRSGLKLEEPAESGGKTQTPPSHAGPPAHAP
jgi:hypothetical protein